MTNDEMSEEDMIATIKTFPDGMLGEMFIETVERALALNNSGLFKIASWYMDELDRRGFDSPGFPEFRDLIKHAVAKAEGEPEPKGPIDMTTLVDDEQIYCDMCGPMTQEDVDKVERVQLAWAEALDKLTDANDVRTVFLTCVNTIGTMGPAYCRIAATTLLNGAEEESEMDRMMGRNRV